MKIFIVTVDEPLYTAETFKVVLNSCNNIAGVSFIKGIFTRKRLITTLRVYGFWRVLKIIPVYLSSYVRGGQVHSLFRHYNPGIPVYPLSDINGKRFLNTLKEMEIDLIISFNCPIILKKEFINLPKHGCLNVHFGMLPKYRGILPIFYAILNNEKEFGVTVHYMNEKIDDGPIILQEAVKIAKNDDLFSLYPVAFKKAGELLVKAVNLISNNSLNIRANDTSQMTYYSYPDRKLVVKYKQLIIKRRSQRLSFKE